MRTTFALIALLFLAACGSSDTGGSGDWGGFASGPSGEARSDSPASPGDSDTSPTGHGAGAGTLTAGAWDDNLNFDFYVDYLATFATKAIEGTVTIGRGDRVVVTVVDSTDKPVPGATITIRQENKAIPVTLTGAEGLANVFPSWAGASAAAFELEATLGTTSARATIDPGTHAARLVLPLAADPVRALDVAFVLDTTGSMGDEIEWLRAEVGSLQTAVSQAFPNIDARWSLVTFKDTDDDYVTRVAPFTTDIRVLTTALSKEVASGGGDYPEALDEALAGASGLAWRGGATARIAFVITDAPHHPGRASKVADALKNAETKGIHIYPIAASGADALTEHTLRSAAEITGGRYLWLTDDSGVGDAHAEPTLPCYLVTKLDLALQRMIATELTGVRTEPTADQILRTGGDPHDGRCALTENHWVYAY